METVTDVVFLDSKITADGDCSHEIKRCLLLGRKVMTNLDSILKGRDITLLTKVHIIKAMVFPVVMYGCYKESWALKNWCSWTVVLEKTLESYLDSKEIKPVNPEGNQSWIFIANTDAEAQAPILWLRSDQSLSRVRLFVTPWTAAYQASLFIVSQSLLRFMSIELVMPSNCLILCHPFFLLPSSIFPSIRIFFNESAFHIRWPKYWRFSLSISLSNE